ncbi:hypothetical protein E4U42_001084 [Claviceps africana]|uniref:Uncharacterized protein n=1 Tax=Claviceps africana TaxID=83212 RepID=A0A8K0IZI6_9HYPO|nr:hypothetical protein E4U42_001084 [Claviceps africana]
MRVLQTLGALCFCPLMAVTALASASPSLDAAWSAGSSVPLATGSCQGIRSTPAPYASGSVNASIPLATKTTAPTNIINATTSHTAGVTGGAIPQQMQASMAGLLGFCIMGLVML